MAFVALFWLGVVSVGTLVPGYAHRADYISSLASRGSPVAPLGMATIASLALAHLAGGVAVWRGWRARFVGALLGLAGLAGLVTAAFRINCPEGPHGCGFEAIPPVPDLGDVVHGYSVIGYQTFAVLAMAALAVGTARGARWPRWLGAISVPLAIVSTLCLMRTGDADSGFWQRLWLACNTAWLARVALEARRAGQASPVGTANTFPRGATQAGL